MIGVTNYYFQTLLTLVILIGGLIVGGIKMRAILKSLQE